jgi:hypothetical protein
MTRDPEVSLVHVMHLGPVIERSKTSHDTVASMQD